MGHLSATVGLHNVADVDAFVCAVIRKHPTFSRLSAHEREELAGEGYLIMCELARKFTPAHARKWSFSTYAGEYLPRRLVTAWHVAHRGEHVRRHRGGWDYRVIASFDAEVARPGFSERGLRRVGEFARVAA